MHIRLLILLPVLIVFLSNEKVFAQWAVIPGLVSAKYEMGVNKQIRKVGSCFGIESQVYGNYLTTGLVVNMGTNKYLDFNHGYFVKAMYQFGLGNYTFGEDENLTGFGVGFSCGFIEADNGFAEINYDYYHHFTGLGFGLFANAAVNSNFQISYNYDAGGRIRLAKYDVRGNFVFHTFSLKFFRWVSLNYTRFSDQTLFSDFYPDHISVSPKRIKLAAMTGNYLYLGFIVTFDNHDVYESIFFPNGY